MITIINDPNNLARKIILKVWGAMGATGWGVEHLIALFKLMGVGGLSILLAPYVLGPILIAIGLWAYYELVREEYNQIAFLEKIRPFILDVLGAAGAMHWLVGLVAILLSTMSVTFPPVLAIVFPLAILGWATYRYFAATNEPGFIFKMITKVLGAGGATGCFLGLLELCLVGVFGASLAFPPLLLIIAPITVATLAGYWLYQEYKDSCYDISKISKSEIQNSPQESSKKNLQASNFLLTSCWQIFPDKKEEKNDSPEQTDKKIDKHQDERFKSSCCIS